MKAAVSNTRHLQLPLLGPASAWRPPRAPPSLKGARRIAIDVETRDPDLRQLGPGARRPGCHIAGIAVGIDGGPRCYLPIRHRDGGNLDERQVLGWARSELNVFDGEVVGAQLIYDLDFLANEDVTFPNVKRFLDVQVAEPLLDEHRYQYNLDALSHDYLGEGKDESLLQEAGTAYGFRTPTEIKNNLWQFHSRYVGPYAEGDVDRPLRIIDMQLEDLQKQDLLRVFDVETKLIPILLAMRRRGVRVNVGKAEEVRAQLVKERDRWLAQARRLAGPKVELMAPGSFVSALRDRNIHPDLTKMNKPSITKAFFQQYAGDELVDAIANGRRVDVIINTFIDGHILRHAINGRVHTTFHQLKSDEGGTIGRFSSEMPNLQNVPARDEELAELVRGLFEADEGEDWERQDESQMEYRMLATYAVGPGSKEIRERYNQDPKTDYHKFCAEMLHVDPEDKVKRKRVKNTNFAKGYGALAPKLALTFGCSVEEAEKFIKEYERALPFTVKTFDYIAGVAAKQGFVRSILGRRARFPLWEPIDNARTKRQYRVPAYPREQAERVYPGRTLVRANTYMAMNRVMQLSNADYMKETMVQCWEAGVCAPDALGVPLLTVHDELDWSVPRTDRGEAAAREAHYIHEHAIKLRVPVLVVAERGPNWGACK